jgi:hypothetical protein
MATKLPEHIRVTVNVYFTSDATGLEVALKMEFANQVFDLAALKSDVPEMVTKLAADMRPMTKAEVDDYLRRLDEEDGE